MIDRMRLILVNIALACYVVLELAVIYYVIKLATR
jgi:hypothetical protein